MSSSVGGGGFVVFDLTDLGLKESILERPEAQKLSLQVSAKSLGCRSREEQGLQVSYRPTTSKFATICSDDSREMMDPKDEEGAE